MSKQKDKVAVEMSAKKGFNRRDFLKVVGAGTGLAASGCATEIPEKLIPYVIQPDEVVPGNAVWYSGTCNECSSGCGVLVRTKEGRALKVEGNPKHPINRGGLCALGQSSVQVLYDPDRLREPLIRKAGEAFKPSNWRDSIDAFADSLMLSAGREKKVVFFTRPLESSEKKLFSAVTSRLNNVEHLEYELFSDAALLEAAETMYGKGTKTRFNFAAADVVLGLGADYLETWMSPVEYSKDFASRRTPERGPGESQTGQIDPKLSISRVYHIEPRLSLTAANADIWMKNAPRTETSLLKAVLSKLAKIKTLSGERKSSVNEILKGFDYKDALQKSGVNEEHFNEMVSKLSTAKNSLVVAGGASVSADAKEAAILSLLINDILGNIGSSVLISKSSTSASTLATPEKIASLVEDLNNKKVGTIVFLDTNPSFSLPRSSGFNRAIANADSIISISKIMDETTKFADIVLPLSTSFESWGDSEPLPGVYALNQPSMQPLFKTQNFGDILLSLDSSSKLTSGGQFKDFTNYRDFIESEWKNRLGSAQFESKWQKALQEGGDWSKKSVTSDASLDASSVLASLNQSKAKVQSAIDSLTVIAFPTVHFHDGRGANRPWMQEIPDPMTTAVWGSWLEIHPDTAKKLSLENGQVVQLKTSSGAIEAPLFFTKHIHPSAVAVPIGQGHEGYGRFASGVGINPLGLLPFNSESSIISLLSEDGQIKPSIAKEKLLTLQFSDEQLRRGFVRSVTEKEFEHSVNAPKSHSAHGHHNALALGPREEPKQMYKQMEHPLYRWGMTIDLSSCTGCSACVAACYAENNVPVVGKQLCEQGREMSWLRIARYLDGPEEHPVTGFGLMMCQHCGNAPCEPVCPVYATYHAEDGLNTMVYNRCVGTRYCSNNCSYKVRRFNWFNYEWPETMNWQLNPDVTVRSVGVMEKCSFCIQRIREAQNGAKDEGRLILDGEVVPACASSCPTSAITFGNLQDETSVVAKQAKSMRGYKVLDFELNTQPAITYLAKVTHQELEASSHHGESHEDGDHHDATVNSKVSH